MRYFCFYILMWVLFHLIAPLEAVEIYFKNKTVQKGHLVSENSTSITIRVFRDDGRLQSLTYPKAVIESIKNVETDVDIYEKMADTLTPSNPKEYYNFGVWCSERGIASAKDMFTLAGSVSPNIRKDSSIKLAALSDNPYDRYRYLQLALWDDPFNKALWGEFENTSQDLISYLNQKNRQILDVLSYILNRNYQGAYNFFDELPTKDHQEISGILREKLGYNINDLKIALIIQMGGTGKPCPKCGGDGSAKCLTCRGEGSIRCNACGGLGIHKVIVHGAPNYQAPCKYCDRRGNFPCPTCSLSPQFGNGKVMCTACFGKGIEIPKSVRDLTPACPRCEGMGRRKCSRCGGMGRSLCTKCDGTGETRSYESSASSSSTRIIIDSSGTSTSRTSYGTTTVPVYKTCIQCRGKGYFKCSTCNEQKYQECSECKGSGRLRGSDRSFPKITDSFISKTRAYHDQIKKEISGKISLPTLIINTDTGEPNSLSEIFRKEEECVFYNGEWVSIEEKEKKTGKKISEEISLLEEKKYASIPLEDQDWLNYFTQLSSVKVVGTPVSPIYRTTFSPSSSKGTPGKYPWFYQVKDEIYFGFGSNQGKCFSFEILGTDKIPLDQIPQASLGDSTVKFVIYYSINKIQWNKEEKGEELKITGWVDIGISGWEIKKGDKVTESWIKPK